MASVLDVMQTLHRVNVFTEIKFGPAIKTRSRKGRCFSL